MFLKVWSVQGKSVMLASAVTCCTRLGWYTLGQIDCKLRLMEQVVILLLWLLNKAAANLTNVGCASVCRGQ
jgi:hypothetical protein